jgi:transposase
VWPEKEKASRAKLTGGDWKPTGKKVCCLLQQEQDGYEFCQKQMAQCDQRLEQYLQQRDRSAGAHLPEEKRKERLRKRKGNKPRFDLRTGLFRMTGTDLTRIDGIDVMTAMTILSETGWDMSKWETEDHFVSWLRLCPDNRISGDKIIGKGRLQTNNRVSITLKLAATTLGPGKTYLGARFRRLRSRLDTPVAIKAMCPKLARLVYRMLRRNEIRGPRSGVLRGPTPPTTDQTSEV